jgi:hypothetical protein
MASCPVLPGDLIAALEEDQYVLYADVLGERQHVAQTWIPSKDGGKGRNGERDTLTCFRINLSSKIAIVRDPISSRGEANCNFPAR